MLGLWVTVLMRPLGTHSPCQEGLSLPHVLLCRPEGAGSHPQRALAWEARHSALSPRQQRRVLAVQGCWGLGLWSSQVLVRLLQPEGRHWCWLVWWV